MATHHDDVSVLFGVPAEPDGLRSDASIRSTGAPIAGDPEPIPLAGSHVVDLIGLRLSVALGRLRDLGIPTRIKVLPFGSPTGMVVWQHPHVGSIVTPDDVVTLGITAGTPVCVPDVILSSESQARADLTAAGLAPGRGDPTPRPATGRSEVVIRTRPRVGSLVPAGSRVDYELLPCEQREPVGLRASVNSDVSDTFFQLGCRPVGARS